MASAGCLAELCAFLSEEELSTVLQQHLLGRWSYRDHQNQTWKAGEDTFLASGLGKLYD